MAILTHGSDLSLSPALGPLVRAVGGTVKQALDRVAKAGFPAVQLDATLPGVRPHELGDRARRDLASLLIRRDLRASGLDLFIPRRHFTDPAHVDRAMQAVLDAIGLAQDLGRLPVSLALPIGKLEADLWQTIFEAAEGRGVPLAVHAEDRTVDQMVKWVDDAGVPGLGMGLDPAAVLAHGRDPGKIVQQLGRRLLVARLSDVQRGTSVDDEDTASGEAVRCAVGRGDLDLLTYRVSCDLAGGRRGPMVLDLRGLVDPLGAAAQAKRAWGEEGPRG